MPLIWQPIFITLFFYLNSCGALTQKQPKTPEATVRAFAIALAEKDYKKAYKLMSRTYRKQSSYRQFVNQLEENPQETITVSNALSHIPNSADQEAVIEYGHKQKVRLVRNGNRWRIKSHLTNFYDQSTPRAALKSFVQAMQRERYDVVMRLVPLQDKLSASQAEISKIWSGESRRNLDRMLNNLQNSINNRIEQYGKHATMLYGDQYKVEFIQENKKWKIVTIE